MSVIITRNTQSVSYDVVSSKTQKTLAYWTNSENFCHLTLTGGPQAARRIGPLAPPRTPWWRWLCAATSGRATSGAGGEAASAWGRGAFPRNPQLTAPVLLARISSRALSWLKGLNNSLNFFNKMACSEENKNECCVDSQPYLLCVHFYILKIYIHLKILWGYNVNGYLWKRTCAS